MSKVPVPPAPRNLPDPGRGARALRQATASATHATLRARLTRLHSAQVPSMRPETTASPGFPGSRTAPTRSAAGQHNGHGGPVGGGRLEVVVARMVRSVRRTYRALVGGHRLPGPSPLFARSARVREILFAQTCQLARRSGCEPWIRGGSSKPAMRGAGRLSAGDKRLYRLGAGLVIGMHRSAVHGVGHAGRGRRRGGVGQRVDLSERWSVPVSACGGR